MKENEIEIYNEDEDSINETDSEDCNSDKSNNGFFSRASNCGKSFKNGSLLNQHCITYGEKNFKCEYPGCTKAFCQKSNLQVHTKHHPGMKDFKCKYPGCAKAFYQKGNLQVHTRHHLG
ncbi:10711_t:CDS:2 [Entrophospora sp. SA101]|nr:10450_t:CDS:2 [Entrophospora sp. SA101]CAJ0841774.1 4050_t:CDS:2 [Entrophospora sp. SA101]CAJ0878624.1 10711_t:CDS:2 [Entrophospora sp. SA101]